MRWAATVALVIVLVDCSGAPNGVDRLSPPGNKPELVCANPSACLTALPQATGTPRRAP